MVLYLPWWGAEIERLMAEADDRALARQAKKEAAAEAAKDKSFAAIYEATQAALSNSGLQTSSAGDAKKGANLFKVGLPSTKPAASSNHVADTVRSMPYCRRIRRQQDRP